MNVTCPNCQRSHLSHPDIAGKVVRCNACGHTFTVPPIKTAVPPPPPPPSPPTPAPYKPLVAWVFAGSVAAAAVVLILAAYLLPRTQRTAATPPSTKASTQQNTIAQKVDVPPTTGLIDERGNTKDSIDPVANKDVEREQLKRLLDVAYVEPLEFTSEFRSNTIAAEKKYGGRMIEVTGPIGAILRNKEGRPLIAFDGASPYMLRVFIHPSQLEKVEQLSVGDKVTLVGTLAGVNANIIDLHEGLVLKESMRKQR